VYEVNGTRLNSNEVEDEMSGTRRQEYALHHVMYTGDLTMI
jgi:hypothetical protein